jgi:hypothetical protein
MCAVGLSFTRAFMSDESYANPIPGAERGELEYQLIRETWLAQRAGR